MSWSLRTRVMISAGAVLGLALGGSGLALYVLVRNTLTKSFDETLVTQIRTLSGFIQIDEKSGDLIMKKSSAQDSEQGAIPDLYELTAQGRRGIRHTPALSDAFLPNPKSGTVLRPEINPQLLANGRPGRVASARIMIAVPAPRQPEHESHEEHEGSEYELLNKSVEGNKKEHHESEYKKDEVEFEYEGLDANGKKVHYHSHTKAGAEKIAALISPVKTKLPTPPAPVPVDIIVAQEVAGLDHDLAMIGWLIFLLISSTILVSEWLMAWAVRRSLRPLNRLADSIAKLDDDDFGKRIKIQDTPTELAPVIDHLNDLLNSIDKVLARERGFSADVSHELRTPLSGLLSTIDVCLRKPRDPENYQHALTTCRRITRQMQGVVGNLLDLTRLESKRTVIPCEPVDLHRLMGTQWCFYTERATLRHVTVIWRLNHGLAMTNADRLGQIISNLFDNAVSYVNEDGMITVNSCERDGKQEIIIANTGSQISAEQVGQVFERFWRSDRARADSHQHCGLGLTLCRRLITVLGGTITVKSQLGGLFEVHLIVPAADLDGEDTISENTPKGNMVMPEVKINSQSMDITGDNFSHVI